MLGGEDHCLDPFGPSVFILDGDLALGVGPQPRQAAAFADFGLALGQLVGEVDRHRHQHLGVGAGVAEHQPLVAGPLVEIEAASFVDPLGDVRRLLVDAGQHRAGLPVEAHVRGVVADFPDGLADDVRHIDPGGGGDFAGDHGHAGGDQGFAGHPGLFVLADDGVEDGVGNLIRHLVGMAFGDRFGGEEIVRHGISLL